VHAVRIWKKQLAIDLCGAALTPDRMVAAADFENLAFVGFALNHGIPIVSEQPTVPFEHMPALAATIGQREPDAPAGLEVEDTRVEQQRRGAVKLGLDPPAGGAVAVLTGVLDPPDAPVGPDVDHVQRAGQNLAAHRLKLEVGLRRIVIGPGARRDDQQREDKHRVPRVYQHDRRLRLK
jgi:hypothetical protein